MRTHCLVSIVLILLALEVTATVRTVSNDTNNPAQYNNVQAAITAASAGDTIYVNGTQYLYPDFTITKKLVLIGAGYNSSNQFNLITQVNYVNWYRDAGVNDASGSVITGFKINSNFTGASGTLPVTNIRIFRCMIGTMDTYPSGANNWVIYNNIFYGGLNGRQASSNTIIQNNIFASNNAGVYNFNQSSIVIDHNIFFNGNAFGSLQFAVVTNNIITSSSGTQVMSNCINNTFNSNLSLSSNISSNAPTNSFLSGANTGGANQVGVDPQYTSVPDLNNFSLMGNYRLQAGSPGHNAGTDGTDLGIYGGSYPFPSGGTPGGGFDTSAFPPIPQVTGMNIQNASILPGAQLKVSVQATVNN